MSSTLTLTGTLLATPVSQGSGNAPLPVFIQEIMALAKKHYDEVTLTDNNPVAIGFGGLTEVNVLFLRAVGGKVLLEATSADGISQVIPVDPLGLVISKLTGFTGLTLVRDASVIVDVTVRIFLGQKQQ